jgi:hypothetical protein
MVVSFFEQLLSTPQPPLTDDIAPIYPNTISAASTTTMLIPLTNDEIKAALFSIPDNKALGPDSYNSSRNAGLLLESTSLLPPGIFSPIIPCLAVSMLLE